MSDTKILFTDLDGTLLDDEKNVSRSDLDAIHEMTEAGHRFVIATGRPLYSAKIVARELDMYRDGVFLACSNGGVLFDCGTQKVISAKTVSYEIVAKLFEAAGSEGLHIHTYTEENVVSLRKTRELEIYCDRIKMPYRILSRIPEDLPALPPKCIVMSIAEGSRHILETFEKKYADITRGEVESVFSNDYLLEYLPVGTSKGNAVRTLCDIIKVPVENAIAIGDEENDIPMIEAAGIGIAMKNGTDAAKKAAGHVTEHTNNESGVSEIIHRFILR